ncbi:2-isopropylmalate synthase [Emcibacter sp.]|uniref:2-isopropylmalate synthase n=1 Tax=Emcibacter sp. TaxID=1979954 RepID=UPI003A941C97
MTIDKNRVVIFDTTLRDGEQSPGASMTLTEKIRVAEALETLGVDVIEAGFAIASNGDFESVNEVAKLMKETSVCSLARASHKDIDRAWEALKPAVRPRIHTFISTSPLHMKYKLQMEPEEVLDAIADSVAYARNLCEDVEWSCEDGTRTEEDFLYKSIETAIRAGATTINVPDTVGYTTPDEYRQMIQNIITNVPNSDKAIFSTHCHNDLGLAVANSIAAVQGGARQIECTINGIGERAGNAALEEIVMAFRTRQDMLPYSTGVVTENITKTSRLVSSVTGLAVQNNKAIVGANAFAHESGIHQDGMLKNAETYEIMTPESVGLKESSLVMGKHSGRHAFREKLKDLGFELGDNEFMNAFQQFKDLADRKKTVYDEDIISIVDSNMQDNDHIKVIGWKFVCEQGKANSADLVLEVDGKEKTVFSEGNGPVDAAFKALRAVIGGEPHLQLYQVHAVTRGTDAQAEVTVRLEEDGKTVNGHAAHTDTLVASARAYANALNKLLTKREKTAPEKMTA